jgi:hypothetical protein
LRRNSKKAAAKWNRRRSDTGIADSLSDIAFLHSTVADYLLLWETQIWLVAMQKRKRVAEAAFVADAIATALRSPDV